MAKTANPRHLYRLYTQKIDPVTFEVVGKKSPYMKALLMQSVVREWYRLTENEGFDHLEVHVEKRFGDRWVEISQLWGSFLEPLDVVFAHYCELELMEYHKYIGTEDEEDVS